LLDQQMAQLNLMIAQAMKSQQHALIRLAEVPGLGVDSAQQIIAEVGTQARTLTPSVIFGSSTSRPVFPTVECRALKTEREALIELFPFGSDNISSNQRRRHGNRKNAPTTR